MLRPLSIIKSLVLLSLMGWGGNAAAETFQEALISAYQSNPGLMAERARVREIDENYVQAQAAGRFTSDVTGSAGYQYSNTTSEFLGMSVSQSDNLLPRAVQLNIIQPLYQGGRVSALKRQANAGILAAREGLRNAEQTLFLQVANAYVDVQQAEETTRIRRNNVRVLMNQEMAAQERFTVGVGTRTDTAQAQSRLSGAKAALALADSELASAQARYERVVGHPPQNLSPVPSFVLPSTLEQAKALGRENNPQLVAAQFTAEAAEHAIDVARAASRPVVSLNGTLQRAERQSQNLIDTDGGSITAQIRIPIFSGGLNKSRVRAARNARARLEFESLDAERAVEEGIAQLWAQVKAARQALTASQEQVSAAQVAFEGVELERDVGTRTALDVLDAEQELLNAKLSVVDARRNLDAARFQMLAVLGAFDAESLQLPVDYYNPADNLEAIKDDSVLDVLGTIVPKPLRKTSDDPNDISEISAAPETLVSSSRE